MIRSTLPVLLSIVTLASYAAGQESPAPTSATANPEPPSAPAPKAAQAEVSGIEIIEPATAPLPGERIERKARVLRGTNGETIWVDGSGEVHALGDTLGLALEFNPDIRAMRAEIEALMARLRAIEMKTATDVARKRTEIHQLRDKREKSAKDTDKKSKDPKELAVLDAEIASREVELEYLIGKDGEWTLDVGPPDEDRVRIIKRLGAPGERAAFAPLVAWGNEARPSLESVAPQSVKKALDRKIQINLEDKPVTDVTAHIKEQYGVNFNVDAMLRGMPISVDLDDVTLEQALRAMAEAADLAFIVRDYGIFVTTRERALTVPGPSIPEGVPYRKGGPRRVVLNSGDFNEDVIEVETAPKKPKP